MTPQAHVYALAKAFFRRAFQVALRCATSLAACNQMQPVVMKALFDAHYQFSGCAAVASGACFDSGEDEAHYLLIWQNAENDSTPSNVVRAKCIKGSANTIFEYSDADR